MTAALLSPAFRSRRRLNWLLAGSMYAFFYMARYNFAAINAQLAETFGWTNARLGVISSVGTLVYGLSVFLNGPLADRIGGRRALLIGAVGAAFANVLFGLMHLSLGHPAVWVGEGVARHVVQPAVLRMGLSGSAVIALFATIWGINHYFQSFGALSIVKINAAWFHLRERGTFAGIFGILIRAGLILAFHGSPLVLGLASKQWQWVFWVPAMFIGLLFILNFLLVRDTPQDAGLPEYETGDEGAAEKGSAATLGFVLRKVFASPVLWTIAGASLMIGFVRRGVIDDWWPKYFANVFHVDPARFTHYGPYVLAAWGIGLVGIVGGICFGMMSDRVFGGRRAPVVVIGFLGQLALLVGFGLAMRLGAGAAAAAFFLMAISFFVNGAHGMVGGAASMDFGGRKAAATAAGLIDGVQYLIAGPLVGVGMGHLLDRRGWGIWPFAPLPFALVGALLMARLWNVLPAQRARKSPPNEPSATAAG